MGVASRLLGTPTRPLSSVGQPARVAGVALQTHISLSTSVLGLARGYQGSLDTFVQAALGW